MLCGFGSDVLGGRLPFVLHPAVLPKLQSIAQRLGLPTPTNVEPPSSGLAQQTAPQMAPTSPIPPFIGIEPLLLSAMMSTLQQSASIDQQPSVNPAAKAFFTLLMQQQAIRNNLLSLVDASNNTNNSPPVQPTIGDNVPTTMDFSPVAADDQSIMPQMATSSGSSEVSPADMTTSTRASKMTTSNSARSFMAPSSSSSPVDVESATLVVKNNHERTPHRRFVGSNFIGGENGVGLIVHGEPIECLPAYAKLANSRWSHKQAAALQRQQQQSGTNNNNNSSLNNSDDMTVGPSPNNNNACSPTMACMHVCIFCGKRYSRKYGLKIHLRTHTGYRPLECRYCHRRFGDPSNLNKHLRLHAQVESPFVCKFCGKSLVRRRDLDRHLRSRHPNMIANATVPTTATPANNNGTGATSPSATLMTPVSSIVRPSSRHNSRQQIAANTMVFPSRVVSPVSSNSRTGTGASHSN